MLLRMFTRYAEGKGFEVELLDVLPGEEAGTKSATLAIKGHNAYGFLKSEKGVHRLVRISPFDSNARRHTSFAAVDVMPEIDNTVEVNINMDDVRVDYYRASGAGGQHVNKTSSAVRMTHLPTGIVVQCQNERSQLQNKERCLQLLRAKLFEYEKAIQDQKSATLPETIRPSSGEPDPLLCFPALYLGQGSSDWRGNRQYPSRYGRGPGSFVESHLRSLETLIRERGKP